MDGGLVADDGSGFLVCCVRHSLWEKEDFLAMEGDAIWRDESKLWGSGLYDAEDALVCHIHAVRMPGVYRTRHDDFT